MAAMAAAKWVWSGVEIETASMSLPSLSSMIRKSLNRGTFGNFLKALAARASSTSHIATRFSLAASPSAYPPMPDTPTTATFIFFVLPGSAIENLGSANALVAIAVDLTKLRRFIYLVCIIISFRCVNAAILMA